MFDSVQHQGSALSLTSDLLLGRSDVGASLRHLGRFWFVVAVCSLEWLLAASATTTAVDAAGSASPTGAPSLFESEATVADLRRGEDLQGRHLHGDACPAILVYYDSTCGHCRSLAPALGNASSTLANDREMGGLLFGAVNCAVFVDECNRHNVSDVPTMFLVSQKLAQRPNGRSPSLSHWTVLPSVSVSDDVVKFIRHAAQPLLVQLPSATQDLCRAIRRFWTAEKQQEIFRSAEAHLAANVGDEGHAPVFVEERHFHESDVATAVHYSMMHEVPLVSLGAANRRVLERFLVLVSTTLPGMRTEALVEQLQSVPPDVIVAPRDWQQWVRDAKMPHQGTEEAPEWSTCKGSAWKYRGFTCGMWLTYHAILANSKSEDDNRLAALESIRAYVLTFFSCSDCRKHFSRFTWRSSAAHQRHWDPLVQLWAAHNQVNRRLRGVTSGGDPLVPKREFPSVDLCATCLRSADAVTSAGGRALASVPTEDVQDLHDAFSAATFDVPRVVEFLERWYFWDAALLPPPPCPDDADTCPVATPHQPLRHQRAQRSVGNASDEGGRHAGAGVWFVRTRHPEYVLRRDPLLRHVLLTVVVAGTALFAGYSLMQHSAGFGGKGGNLHRRRGQQYLVV